MIISPPPQADYNPAGGNPPNPPACIWELLRRNPAFRQLIGCCEPQGYATPSGNDDAGQKVASIRSQNEGLIQRRLTWLTLHNPFAACALNWALRPKFVELGLHRPLNTFFTPINCDAWEWIDLVIPKMGCKELKTMERLIKSDLLGYTFTGPLTCTSGEFNLNTPWPRTPPLFRFHFQWLWAEFDPSLSGIDGRPFVPFLSDVQPAQSSGLVTMPWDWEALRNLNTGDTLDLPSTGAMEDVADLFTNNFVFAVPKAPLSMGDRKAMVEKIKTQLEQLITDEGYGISTNKLKGVLGCEEEWANFTWCREFLEYEQESKSKKEHKQREIHRKIIFKERVRHRLEHGQIQSADGADKSVIENYEAMERLMFAVYPRFNWPDLMELRLGVAKKKTQPTHKRALQVCGRKLAVAFKPLSAA